jgi:hypothetical protein
MGEKVKQQNEGEGETREEEKKKKNKFVVLFRLAAHTTQTLPIKSEGRED